MSDNLKLEKVNLKKTISLFSACTIIIGTIVGSGIFISPNGVLKDAGSPGMAIIIWLISGLISLTGAICYTELGTIIQTSGGDYVYINECFGSLLSFLYIWTMIFVCLPCLNGIAAITIAQYTVKLFSEKCADSPTAITIIAALILCFLGFINTFNLTVVNKVQAVFTLTKIMALFFIISAGIWSLVNNSSHSYDMINDWFPSKASNKYDQIALSLYSGLYTYSGWFVVDFIVLLLFYCEFLRNCLNFLTEEMKSPSKNLPRAIFIALPVIIIIYLLTNVAYYIVLTPEEILQSHTVALTFSEKVFPRSLAWLTPLFISFSSLGSLTSSIMTTSRIYYAAARDGNLPNLFAMISIKYFSPVTSIVLVTLTSLIVLMLGDVQTLILYGTFTELLFIGISISSIVYLRYKKPDIKRPIKLWLGIPIFFLIICVCISFLTLYQYTTETLKGIFFMLIGVPVYYVGKYWRPNVLRKIIGRVTIFLQKLFICSKED